MYAKRFLQLFIIWLVASAIVLLIAGANFTHVMTWLAILIGYLILLLPLVALTIVKARKKANIVGSQAEKGELTSILKRFPGYIALSLADGTTIMSFTQDKTQENIWYMVADPETTKAKSLTAPTDVSFTTWFDDLENGARLSSNRATLEKLSGADANTLITQQPHILDIHENAANMAVLRLTVHSALYEDFKDGLKVLAF
ncbi:MAG: pyridoxamine 5'-phosphate oxidase family protein [Streptococcaceae bacterium]|jgi:ABC-type multidrug transport system fused ATPase/permease subunit|nr:pyridoxamine 5'-phosphate oxidase family protein [Streptococcaceae bacterium]